MVSKSFWGTPFLGSQHVGSRVTQPWSQHRRLRSAVYLGVFWIFFSGPQNFSKNCSKLGGFLRVIWMQPWLVRPTTLQVRSHMQATGRLDSLDIFPKQKNIDSPWEWKVSWKRAERPDSGGMSQTWVWKNYSFFFRWEKKLEKYRRFGHRFMTQQLNNLTLIDSTL